MNINQNKLQDIWLKASVVGSLWASVEIIIGSFFHNMRIPMAGTILAMISVAIMVAFHRHWKEKGLFWRAGLICALMKSISPSAILLGPMTGILTEAFIMELAVRFAGANMIGYMIGGALALASTIAHKIVNLIIIYGLDFVTIIANLYDFAVNQIGYPGLKPEIALWILFGVYAMLGIFAALSGYFAGNKKPVPPVAGSKQAVFDSDKVSSMFELNADQHFSLKLLFMHVFVVVICLVILQSYPLWMGTLFIAVYVAFCVYHYKQSLKHLKRPFFWVQVLVLTFLATLFFNGFQKGNIFDQEGLMAGLQMNIRAILILVGFSVISVELRNPVIKNLLIRRGFSQLYLSLGLAFSVLPAIIKNFSRPRQIIKRPMGTIREVLQNADGILEHFKYKINKPKVVLITADRHEGKTTWAQQLAGILQEKGYRTGGFLAPGEFEKNRRSAFDILDLKTGKRKPLCSIHRETGEAIGPFRFDPEGQKFGQELLSTEKLGESEIVFIDEVGPMELKGGGWADSIDRLMEQSGYIIVMIVRKSLTKEVINKWGLINVTILDITNKKPEESVDVLFF